MDKGREKTMTTKILSSARYWTEEQTALLKNVMELGGSYADAVAATGRSYFSVRSKCDAEGFKNKSANHWTAEELQFLRDNYYTKPMKIISIRLGRSEKQIAQKRRSLGMVAKNTPRSAD